jgi:hypothetical protein
MVLDPRFLIVFLLIEQRNVQELGFPEVAVAGAKSPDRSRDP